MAEEEAKHIVLELGGRDFRFVRQAALRNYETFINTAAAAGKMAKAANNYCIAALLREDLAAFRQLKGKNPRAALQAAGELADLVAPDLEATVKKR